MNAGAVPSDADEAPPSTAAPPLAAMDSRLQSYSLRKLCMTIYRLPGSHQQHRSAYQCGNNSCAWLEGGATAGCRQGGEKRQGRGRGRGRAKCNYGNGSSIIQIQGVPGWLINILESHWIMCKVNRQHGEAWAQAQIHTALKPLLPFPLSSTPRLPAAAGAAPAAGLVGAGMAL